MRTLKLYHSGGVPSSGSFVIDRGGLLRHILHSVSFRNPGVGANDMASSLKTNNVNNFEDLQDTAVLSSIFCAWRAPNGGDGFNSGPAGFSQFLNFVDVLIPDRSTLYLNHQSLGGVAAAGIHTFVILYLEGL